MKPSNHHEATPGTPAEAKGSVTPQRAHAFAAVLAKEATFGKARRVEIHAPSTFIQANDAPQFAHKHLPRLAYPMSKESQWCKDDIRF
jgi:hypothetical protein